MMPGNRRRRQATSTERGRALHGGGNGFSKFTCFDRCLVLILDADRLQMMDAQSLRRNFPKAQGIAGEMRALPSAEPGRSGGALAFALIQSPGGIPGWLVPGAVVADRAEHTDRPGGQRQAGGRVRDTTLDMTGG